MLLHPVPHAILLLEILLAGAVSAQAPVGSTDNLTPGVSIRFRDAGKWITGSLVSVTADSIELANAKTKSTETYSLSGLSELWYSAGKKPAVARGMAVGALLGAATAGGTLLIYSALDTSGWETTGEWAYVGVCTAAGAALGALLGALKPQDRWVAVQMPRAQVVIVPTRNGAGLGVSVRF